MTRSIQARYMGLAFIVLFSITFIHCGGGFKVGLDEETLGILGGKGDNEDSDEETVDTCAAARVAYKKAHGEETVGSKGDGKKPKDDDEDSDSDDDTENTDSDDDDLPTGCADGDVYEEDAETGGNTTTVSSGTGDVGNSASTVPYFLGTYKRSQNNSYTCPDWPTNFRLYTQGSSIVFVNIDSTVIVIGRIFSDGSIDFTMPYLDQFGAPTLELTCVCSYYTTYSPTASLACNCELGQDWCELRYTEVN